MKKNFIRIICLLVKLFVCCGLFGCAGMADSVSNTVSDIEIIYWESGYGRQYMDNLVKRFNEKYPEYKATLVSSAAVSNNTIYMDPASNTADLYITTFELKNAYKEYLQLLEP